MGLDVPGPGRSVLKTMFSRSDHVRGSSVWSLVANPPGPRYCLHSAANVVVLDEVGTRQTVSDFQYETFKRAIDEREGKPAVFIANVDLSAIGRLFDARIASRLSAGTIVQTEGDRRMRKLRLAE